VQQHWSIAVRHNAVVVLAQLYAMEQARARRAMAAKDKARGGDVTPGRTERRGDGVRALHLPHARDGGGANAGGDSAGGALGGGSGRAGAEMDQGSPRTSVSGTHWTVQASTPSASSPGLATLLHHPGAATAARGRQGATYVPVGVS
jgi:hypothetical protein